MLTTLTNLFCVDVYECVCFACSCTSPTSTISFLFITKSVSEKTNLFVRININSINSASTRVSFFRLYHVVLNRALRTQHLERFNNALNPKISSGKILETRREIGEVVHCSTNSTTVLSRSRVVSAQRTSRMCLYIYVCVLCHLDDTEGYRCILFLGRVVIQ